MLAEFAERLVTGFQAQEILDHLVLRIVDLLPVAGAGVMLMSTSGELHFVAASDEKIRKIETLQNELGEGPGHEAYRSGSVVSVPTLTIDSRFPRFSQGARDAGLAAVFTLPMSIDGHRFGALDLYRDQEGPLDTPTMEAAQVLANVAAAYLHFAQDRAETADTLDLMRRRSLHDALTGLPNRVLLQERLEQAIARARRSRTLVAVLFVDLDEFKAVNDNHGHQVGDLVLVAAGERMSSIVRSGETVARLAGDEFVIVCENLDRASQAERIADKIARALAVPYQIQDRTLTLSASIGVAFCGPGNALPDTLIRDADEAMYQAKQAGGSHHRLLDEAARLADQRHAITVRDLGAALVNDQMQLAYQPIITIADHALHGVEAMLRWNHPELGWIAPGLIERIAESTDLMAAVGSWTLTRACQDFSRWRHTYDDAVPSLTVHLSVAHVMQPDLADTVSRALASAEMEPARLVLAVTEAALLHNDAEALTALTDINGLGVRIGLAGFGTGRSSLTDLCQFPFDVLDIDQELVGTLVSDTRTQTVVAAVVGLAHRLDLTLVAKAVETAEQMEELRRLGVDHAQGSYCSKPLLLEEIESTLLRPRATHTVLHHLRASR